MLNCKAMNWFNSFSWTMALLNNCRSSIQFQGDTFVVSKCKHVISRMIVSITASKHVATCQHHEPTFFLPWFRASAVWPRLCSNMMAAIKLAKCTNLVDGNLKEDKKLQKKMSKGLCRALWLWTTTKFMWWNALIHPAAGDVFIYATKLNGKR